MAFAGFLRQSTAVDILLGPYLDDADGDTPQTGLTLDVELSKNGQGLANKSDATTPVHDSGGDVDGYYNCELDTTDTGTLGILTIVVHHADALATRLDYMVIPQLVYDALFAGTDYLQVDAVQVEGADATDTIQSSANAALVANKLDHLALVADGDDVADNSIIAKLACKGATADWTTYNNTTDSLEAAYDNVGGNGVTLSAIPWNSAWDTEVNADCQAALTAQGYTTTRAPYLDELAAANLPTDIDAILADTGTDGVVVAAGSKTGYSLAADQSAVTIGTVTTLTGHTAQTGDSYAIVSHGTYGNAALDTDLTSLASGIAGLNDLSAAQVNAEVVDALATDTYTEPGQGAPGVTVSITDKIGYLYKAWRNKSDQSSSTYQLYDDAGTTVDQKSTVSDDGSTSTRQEIASGP